MDRDTVTMSYLDVPRARVPLALADLHRALELEAPVELVMLADDHGGLEDDLPGRVISGWEVEPLVDVVAGAGFAPIEVEVGVTERRVRVRARRARRLPDSVSEGMRLLVCGLNPSLYTADAGVGYARPGNRFWPAALASGLVTRDRDPLAALHDHGVGMTNLVLRATPRADQVSAAEYREGAGRVSRLVEWLQPRLLCVVGITGWRVAVDKRAQVGLQPEPLGGRPVYVMPNTSGLNAHAKPADYERHLRAAIELADASPP